MICLVNLVGLNPPNNGGVSRIAKEVILLLISQSRQTGAFHPVFAVPPHFSRQFHDWLGDGGNDILLIPYDGSVPVRPLLATLKPDLIVSPLFGGEPFSEIDLFRNTPHVVAMPDALALDLPNIFSSHELAYRNRVYTNLKSCTRIVTISEYSRDRLSTHLQIPASSISVVRLGADSLDNQQSHDVPIEGRYVYYPANNWPHKRHELLFQIMNQVWLRDPEIKLVLSGSRGTGFGVSIEDLTRKYNAPANMIYDLGFVPDSHIRSLYEHAEAMLFVSQYEGFGMPIIEAMKYGCPVICAPVSAIPEVANNAAIFVNSDDPQIWASALLDKLPMERKILIRRGHENVKRFSWSSMRTGWLNVLQEVGLPNSRESALPALEPMIPLSAALAEFTQNKHPYTESTIFTPIDFDRSFKILSSFIDSEETNRLAKIPIIGRAYRAYHRVRFLPKNWKVTLSVLQGILEYQIQIEQEIESFRRNPANRDIEIKS